ncbi:MAG: hypothetical protein EPN92_04085 [Chitinophagaceae bacterium]|nr:MAG: hypothetical protein EPN92_04085 [Chitinophagaceae bacterium]
MKSIPMIWRIIYSILFTVIPGVITYMQFLTKKSSEYRFLVEWMPLIVGISITVTVFCLVMLVFHLYNKAIKNIYINEIVFNAALEGLDQNPDGKSYTNKEDRVLDALKKNPNLSSKEVDEIMKDKFPKWRSVN